MPSVLAPFRAWLSLLALAPTCFAQTSAPEPLLSPGPFAVGFRSTWVFDEGRTYRTSFDEGATYGAESAPRPLLVLLWYPARDDPAVERMPHGQYFSIASEDARLARYAPALAAYARGVFVEQVLGVSESALDERGRAALADALSAPTLCRPGAEPAPGPFPIVVYHCGAGSSFEDNAALCAWLASCGFVVLGSAFPEADGSSFGIDGGRGSAEDVQFLVRWAGTLPFADRRHVALAGHSAGAQAMLRHAARPGRAGDALVLLDTTQDYYELGMPQHEALVREVTEGLAALTHPMLVAAGPEAMFALCDTLVNAERTYLTVPELGHDEFISQGLQRLERIGRQALAAPDGADAAEVTRTPQVRANYRTLCEVLRSFLDAELRDQRADFATRLARQQPWSHERPCLVRVPRGTSTPDPWDPGSTTPPSPRQFRRLLEAGGAEAACAVLERFRDAQPRGPLYTSTMMAGSLLYGLVQHDRRDEAKRYYSALRELPLPVLTLFSFLADVSSAQHKREQALHFLRVALELDPEDAGIAAKLRELEQQPR